MYPVADIIYVHAELCLAFDFVPEIEILFLSLCFVPEIAVSMYPLSNVHRKATPNITIRFA